MCGILLYKTKDTDKVKKSFDLIKNRGPDGTSLVSVGKYIMGHHRLSIVKLESGNQPISVKYGNTTYTLVCNGEIYNYDKLTQRNVNSDCEVIIDMYVKKKLNSLDGDFAFVLHILDEDGNENIITGRDIIGLKPLYLGYNKSGKLVGVSSEIKVLENIESRIIVKSHPIGTIIDHSNDEKIEIMPPIKQVNDDIKTIINTIKKLMYESVKKRLFHSERPITVLCSGGIDSVIISAIVIDIIDKNCQENKKKLELYTLSYDKDSYDLIYSNIFYGFVKEKYPWIKFTLVELNKQVITDDNIKNTIYTIESYDPNSIRAAMPMYFLAKYISKNSKYKVVLSGEGSDELFMGYNYFSNDGVNSTEAAEESRRLVNNLHSFDLLRAERVFSSNGLELRVPFLDKEVISYVTNLPGDIRLPMNGTEKYLLRLAFEDVIRNVLMKEKNVFDSSSLLRDDDREINNLIFRQKDRLSDGISGKWVPDLLTHVVGEKPSLNTDKRLKIEKECYKKIYSSMFSNDVIIHRKLPEWAEDKVDKNVLNNVVEERLKEFGNITYVDDIKIARSNKSLEPEKIEKGSSKSFNMNLSYNPNVI